MLGLNNAGKTSILFKMNLGEFILADYIKNRRKRVR